ncbi:MAG: hypothetical protein RBS02_01260 [Steroidobacteraceae bacterium]|jgi:hypothetical protein|nr:hypothetical protein [Steroidobacteraceae bacterium]
MRQIAPEMDVAKRNIGGFVKEGYEITTPADRKAFAFLNKDGTIELDISNFHGGGGGSAVYQAVGDWAANQGHRFIGDTSGLSPVAQIRRTPNMLSSALRHGTTAHLEPHPLQITPEVKGVQPLSWRPGDDAYNVSQLADSYVKTHQNLVPEISGIRYNTEVGRFEDELGRAVTDEEFLELLKLARGRDLSLTDVSRGVAGTPPIGSSDLKRVALLQSGLRSLHGRGLAQSGRELSQRNPALHPALRGLLYGAAGALPVAGLLHSQDGADRRGSGEL